MLTDVLPGQWGNETTMFVPPPHPLLTPEKALCTPPRVASRIIALTSPPQGAYNNNPTNLLLQVPQGS